MKLGSDLVAVVAGGASGLGAAVSAKLAGHGVKVAILDRDVTRGEQHADQIGAMFCRVDVASASSVRDALAKTRSVLGQERVCINCAGLAPAAKTVSRNAPHDPELFQSVINVNLVGSFNVASQSAAGMVEAFEKGSDAGVIVNTASIAAYEGQVGQAAYAASKGGIVGLTLPMARDLAEMGIRVMAIAPGIFATPMVTSMPDDLQATLANSIPNPSRLGDPDEFAGLVTHIIENSYMNGTVIRLDGAVRLAAR